MGSFKYIERVEEEKIPSLSSFLFQKNVGEFSNERHKPN